MNLNDFWDISPKQFEKYIKVYELVKKTKAKEDDINSYNLGIYISFAINSPEKYPKKPFLQENESKGMTVEQMDAMMRGNTIALGGEIK